MPRIIDRGFPSAEIGRALVAARRSAPDQDADLRSWFSPVSDLTARAVLLACVLPSCGNERDDCANILLLIGAGEEAEQIKKRVRAASRVDRNAGITDLLAVIEKGKPRRKSATAETTADDQRAYEREAVRRVGARMNLDATDLASLVMAAGDQHYGRIVRYLEPMAGVGGMMIAAAHLGMSVRATELHPIAAIGATYRALAGSAGSRAEQSRLAVILTDRAAEALSEIDDAQSEDGADILEYVYAIEARDPSSSYWTPILPTFLISRDERLWLEPVPNPRKHQVDLVFRHGGSPKEIRAAENLRTWGPGGMVSIIDIDGNLRPKGEELSVGQRHALVDPSHWGRHDAMPRGGIRERLAGVFGTATARGKRWLPVDRRILADEEALLALYDDERMAWLREGLIPDELLPDDIVDRDSVGWTRLLHLYHPRHLWPRIALLRSAQTTEERRLAAWMIACGATRDSRLASFGARHGHLSGGERAKGETTMFTAPSWRQVLQHWRSFLPASARIGHDISFHIADAATEPLEAADVCLLDFSAPAGAPADAEVALAWAAPTLRETEDAPRTQRAAGDSRSPLSVRSIEDMCLVLRGVRPESCQRLLLRTDDFRAAPHLIAEAHQIGWKIVASWALPGSPKTTRLWVLLPRDRNAVGYRSELEEACSEAQGRPETSGRLVALLSVLSSCERIVGVDIPGALRGESGPFGAAIRSAAESL